MRKIFILRHIKNKSLQRGSFRMSMSAVSNRLQACGAHSCGNTVVKSIWISLQKFLQVHTLNYALKWIRVGVRGIIWSSGWGAGPRLCQFDFISLNFPWAPDSSRSPYLYTVDDVLFLHAYFSFEYMEFLSL